MTTPTQPSPDTPSIALVDPDGKPQTLGDYAADRLVVILVRYFGCLPCQDFVREVDRVRHRFPDGSRVIAIGGSADHQARLLRDTKGVEMPLLLDPDQQVRAVAGLGDLSARQLMRLGGWANYLSALRKGFRPQVPTADARKAPGVVIFDAGFNVVSVHRGEMMGDYPTIEQPIASLAMSD